MAWWWKSGFQYGKGLFYYYASLAVMWFSSVLMPPLPGLVADFGLGGLQ